MTLQRRTRLQSKKPLRRFTELRRTPGTSWQNVSSRSARVSGGLSPAGEVSPPVVPRSRARSSRFLPDAAAVIAARSQGLCEIQLDDCRQEATQKSHRITQKSGGRHRAAKRRSDRASNALHACWHCHHVITCWPWTVDAEGNGWVLREWNEPTAEPVMYRGEWVYLDDAGGVHDYETAGA